jgi:hypothetical protein
VRGGGDPESAGRTRRWVLGLAGGAPAGMTLTALAGWFSGGPSRPSCRQRWSPSGWPCVRRQPRACKR